MTAAMRVLRVSHSGGNPAFRLRDRTLAAQGVDLTLVVPEFWGEPGYQTATEAAAAEDAGGLTVRGMPVDRPGDVNRHRYTDPDAAERLVATVRPDLVDVHEEPFSLAARQWLRAASRRGVPTVVYTAQNLDKRFPPPFAQYEAAALRTALGVYPCSRQAASVVRGKGFGGVVEVLPLGYDDVTFHPGAQRLTGEVLLALVGRIVPEKGCTDAVDVLATVHRSRPARLVVIGQGPGLEALRARAASRGVLDRVEVVPWLPAAELAEWYRRAHVLLVPSRSTSRWVEQFGRTVVEARACGAVTAGYGSGAIPQVVGDAGLLVPEGDAAALGLAVADLVATPSQWDMLRVLGVALSREYTWRAVAARQVSFYEKALAERGTPIAARLGGSEARRRARLEFGEPARLPGPGPARPFAVPFLRDSPALSRAVGGLVDAVVR